MTKRPTSRDVAARAGVSQSTVSFVFTGKSGISSATKARVLKAATELHYRPNLAARSMRTRQTGRIAVAITTESLLYSAALLEGATAVARDAGFVVELVTVTTEQAERSLRLREVILSGEFEGLLSFVPVTSQLTDETQSSATVVLSLAEFDDRLHATGQLTDAQPLIEMMEHLYNLGHRHFLHIGGSYDFPSAIARREAYLSTIERLGAESLGVYDGEWRAEAGYDVIRTLAADVAPFALIAANDHIATGAIRAAAERGWSVPGMMSVTGWDDLPQSAWLVPPLTTVIQDREAFGAYTMRLLIATMRKQTPPERPDDLQRIIWRQSHGSPKLC